MNIRPFYAAGLLALLALACVGACQTADPELAFNDITSVTTLSASSRLAVTQGQPGLETPLESFRAAPGSVTVISDPNDPVIPLSYKIKQMQVRVAREFVWVARSLISGRVGTTIDASHWQTDHMILTLGGDVRMTFRHFGWDPEHTDEEFGPRKLLGSSGKHYRGAGFLAALGESSEGLDYKQAQTVTSSHSREVTLDEETTIDIGVEVGTTIGGDNYGVSVEAKLSTEFGKRIDNSQTDAESKSTEVTKEINYFFPPHKDTLLTLDTRSVQTQRWLRINGVSNVGLTVSWPVSLTWALSG